MAEWAQLQHFHSCRDRQHVPPSARSALVGETQMAWLVPLSPITSAFFDAAGFASEHRALSVELLKEPQKLENSNISGDTKKEDIMPKIVHCALILGIFVASPAEAKFAFQNNKPKASAPASSWRAPQLSGGESSSSAINIARAKVKQIYNQPPICTDQDVNIGVNGEAVVPGTVTVFAGGRCPYGVRKQ
jgi:hypothetical protein